MKTLIAAVAVAMHMGVLAGAGYAAPYTRIVEPVQGQCVPGPDVKVKFQAGGMQLGPTAWNLHFKLDEEPFQIQYDGNHAHTFKNVLPGTHTVRIYAANAMQEAIAGTQSVVTFNVGYGDNANAPVPGQPLLTYNLPQGEYLGIDAGDITVDFLLQNAVLSPNGYQVAYYVDGRRFLVQDLCGPRHIKDLNPGFHRVRIELQDANGDTVPGAFNSTERVILVSSDSVVKSPAGATDGYTGLPRLDSIKGSMTMGQHWAATVPDKPLTQAEIEKQKSLTVHTQGGTVGLTDGVPVAVHDKEVSSPGGLAGPYTMTSQPSADNIVPPTGGEFTVRQGASPDEAPPVDLDSAVPTSVRSGSIPVKKAEVETDVNVSAPVTESDSNIKAGSITVRKDSPVPAAGTATAPTSGVTSGTRVRADGSRTALAAPTSGTLSLSDKPAVRRTDDNSTTTIRVEDSGTSGAKARTETGQRRTSGSATSAPRGDGSTSGSNISRRSSPPSSTESTTPTVTGPPAPTLN